MCAALDPFFEETRASLQKSIAKSQTVGIWTAEKLGESQAIIDKASALFGTAHDFTTMTRESRRGESPLTLQQLSAAATALEQAAARADPGSGDRASPLEIFKRVLLFCVPLLPAAWYLFVRARRE
jgi:hypothetical protein